ncbi:transport protein Avl9-domain-containing protein [Amylocystis lapponica]|nr:transport protein Avl9-domain-containing protein [Amylocystis lapponica]
MPSPFDDSPPSLAVNSHFLLDPPSAEPEDDENKPEPSSDDDTASQRSIPLSSAPHSPHLTIAHTLPPEADDDDDDPPKVTPVTLVRQNLSLSKRNTIDTDLSSDGDQDDRSFFVRRLDEGESPVSSLAPSVDDRDKVVSPPPVIMPVVVSLPPPPQNVLPLPEPPLPPLPPMPPRPTSSGTLLKSDTASVKSVGSDGASYSKKARPESLLVQLSNTPLVLGIALVDFDHLVGPKIEFSRGSIFDDEEIAKILPFLALPDGAHLTTEDYSYFHLVPASPNPSTIFGISCNRQIQTADLLVKDADVTRSTVQKAVVVLASKPVFGLIRDRLGVITRALFAQRDFTDMSILDAFQTSLEHSLRSQLTESGLYMGTNLRDLVHTFRQRTLVLVKALMLQKKIMFFGHPVEQLCTYQYSLVTLVPGLLQNLDDCGSPPLAARAQSLSRPTSLRTSDHKSMMAYVGLPLDLFGKDAFFQPYLPLQQLDMLKETRSWLCGSTNSIVTQQKEVDLLVNIENGTIEFRDPKLERSAGLTAADRRWMDDIVRDVNETFNDDSTQPLTMHFKGSDDYLRQKFEEYISGALASVKYAEFVAKGANNGVMITDGSGGSNSTHDFNALWISEFKKTNAYEVWERVTDPLLFDIVEARHPCNAKPSVVSDIGLRLSEGIQELKLDQQLAPTRDAISRTFSAAVEGVRGRWMQRASSSSGTSPPVSESSPSRSSSIVEVSKADAMSNGSPKTRAVDEPRRSNDSVRPQANGLRPLSMAASHPVQPPTPEPTKFTGWVGSFFAQRSARNSTASSVRRDSSARSSLAPSQNNSPLPSPPAGASRMSAMQSVSSVALGKQLQELEEIQPKNLDEVYSGAEHDEHTGEQAGVAL